MILGKIKRISDSSIKKYLPTFIDSYALPQWGIIIMSDCGDTINKYM
jgi:hypothetical protein